MEPHPETDESRISRALAAFENARRQPPSSEELKSTLRELTRVARERDAALRESSLKQEVVWEMRRLAEHLGIADGTAESDSAFVWRQVLFLVKERDELKRIADALETKVGSRGGLRTLTLPSGRAVADAIESGPGIAALPTPRPDNSVAHLDVDLLCEDA